MSIISRIFGNNQGHKKCPRCLGKGNVDWNDIKRLNQELKWKPGTCAYCNGSGEVPYGIEENVPVDAAYLVTNLPEDERKLIVKGNPDAQERGKQWNDKIEILISQIYYLHSECGLNPMQIAKFYFIGSGLDSYEDEIQDFIEYVERVIRKKTSHI
jgi:excinuclease UvrABC ATPase subunit